ncbi:hypothetical protein SUBVAR_07097 [Subdoligranulum variabile DSM 15176]|uniref:Uncharacterized protein n=1 Tax=Subdoligranulum variabile DSM 15176 TaxID=411471 RepID=D1PRT9_9FIRM|nr:hypothetical protein SUBVAR_07097 [Subdoligranulum variabile DSM 15176]
MSFHIKTSCNKKSACVSRRLRTYGDYRICSSKLIQNLIVICY